MTVELTAPGQKILPMHHDWTGGMAAWAGTNALRGTVGLATEVETVTVGTPVVAGAVDVWEVTAPWA